MAEHDRCSWNCACWHIIGGVVWTLAALSLVAAWTATVQHAFLGFEAGFWFGNAFALGVLAIPLKLKGGHGVGCSCGYCEVPPKKK